ncbi:MAG: peptidoglycan-binding protein LysM [Candidatus Aminicenantes bacterium]|nr:peptidoglycan-binding protein LysM [Candidatus Aminicenantes bacterium]
MGLFDFAKDAGKSIDTHLNMAQEVQKLGLDVEDLDVKFEDGTVKVGGAVKTQEDREKVILALGNVSGVGRVDDSLDVGDGADEAVFYMVKPGDSLSKIAKVHYGNAMKYPEIFEANKPMLSDPNKIYPGQVLRIPKL